MINFLFALTLPAFAGSIRTLNLRPNEVGQIHTTARFSTFIELNQKPTEVSAGDQGSFKIEYVKNGISIRPTFASGKTNLFVFTENDCYVFLLETGSEQSADFKVSVRRIYESPGQAIQLAGRGLNKKISAKFKSVTGDKEKSFIDFSIENKGPTMTDIEPEGFRIVQDGRVLTLRGVYLSDRQIAAGASVTGTLSVEKFNPTKSAEFWILTKGDLPKKLVISGSKSKGPKNVL